MANEQNLKPLNTRTPRERKEIAQKGAAASNKVQANKNMLREAAKLLLDMPVTDKQLKDTLKDYKIPAKEQSYAMAMVIGQVKAAISGNTTAFNAIRDIIGEKPVEEKEELSDKQIVFNILPASEAKAEKEED